MLIAIDGPAASGKGTLGLRLAAHFELPHLDTGKLYRAVARVMLDRGLPLGDEALAAEVAAALEPDRIADERLRGAEMGEAASLVSQHGGVRAGLLAFQRRFAGRPSGAVLDGRDIGTVVCPGADVKLFVTATPEERAARRFRELAARGETTTMDEVRDDILRRDRRDRERVEAPLRPAPDAHILDTSALDAEAAFGRALAIVETSRIRRPS